MILCYIAGPFRASNAWEVEKNIRRAEELGYRATALGVMPLIPHTMTRFFDGTRTDEFWIEGTLELLLRCDAVLVVPGWENSAGTRGEIAEAAARGIPIFYSLSELAAWISRGKNGKIGAVET